MDVYAEVLRWQKQMQDKSTEEAQIVLNSNLEQIAKVKLFSFFVFSEFTLAQCWFTLC